MEITKGRIAKVIIATLTIGIISASCIVYAGAVNNDNTKNDKNSIEENVKKPVVLEPSTIQYNDRQALLFDITYSDVKSNTILSPLAFEMQLALGANGNTKSEIEIYTGKSVDDIKNNYSKLKIKELPTIIIDGNIELLDDESDNLNNSNENSKININNNVIKTYEIRDVIAENITTSNSSEIESDVNDIINQFIIGDESKTLTSIYTIDNSKIRFSTKSKDVFHRFGDKDTNVTMLNSVESIYLENDYATGFMKQLTKDSKTMFIGILPKKQGAFDLLELDITSLISSKRYEKVKVGMPELSIVEDYNLTDNLLILDIPNWFSSYDELIELKQTININITGEDTILIQQNKLDDPTVEGYEPKDNELNVYLNRPFAFVLYDTETEDYILLGKITNPKIKD